MEVKYTWWLLSTQIAFSKRQCGFRYPMNNLLLGGRKSRKMAIFLMGASFLFGLPKRFEPMEEILLLKLTVFLAPACNFPDAREKHCLWVVKLVLPNQWAFSSSKRELYFARNCDVLTRAQYFIFEMSKRFYPVAQYCAINVLGAIMELFPRLQTTKLNLWARNKHMSRSKLKNIPHAYWQFFFAVHFVFEVSGGF